VPSRANVVELPVSKPGPPQAITGWRQRLPRHGPCDRAELLLDFSAGRRLVHVGFVDERRMDAKLEAGTWLHARLARVAESIVGLDLSEEGVRWAREQGFEAYAVDAQSPTDVAALGLHPAGVVVAGEIIEHLDAPGPFLRGMRSLLEPDGLLVVTTPNAYRLLNLLAPASGSELIHPDHTAWHSPHTLRNLLVRNGWEVEGMAYYQNPAPRLGGLVGTVVRGARAAFVAAGRLAPYWCDGLVAWARPAAAG
jgi:SAM-dependent methyltransferase